MISQSVRRLSSCLLGAASAAALAASVPAVAQAPAARGPLVTIPIAVAIEQLGPRAWGLARTDIVPDPAIRYGRLPNGMQYAIMRNATPKGAASVRLHFEFGSLGESENERGLAHFIEHMAFNGTTNVPEGNMIKILERQGLAFGPDTNAATGFDTTTYMLDLPKADAERLDTAFFLFREVASEVKFDQAAIDRERGVILGERRARDSYQLRQIIDQIGFQLPDTPYSKRLPIGTEEVLRTASAATFKDLYRRYYRPENTTLVFVGDADPAAIEARIVKTFSDWKGVGPAGAELPRGRVDLKRPAAFDTFVDPAMPTTVDLSVMRAWEDPADTVAERRASLIRSLASGMLNRRISRLTNAPGSPLLGGAMFTGRQIDAALTTTVKIAARDGEWQTALATAEQEVRRAVEHGFTDAELKTQLAATDGALKAAAAQAATRTNPALASMIVGTVGRDNFVTAPAYGYALFGQATKGLTVAEVNAEFRRLWQGSAPLVHVSDKKDGFTDASLAAAFADSRAKPVPAPQQAAAIAFAYADWGTAGKVAEDKRVADLGIRTIRFANNVRLNLKTTDFEKGRIRFQARMAGGQLALPADKAGLAMMMTMLSGPAALGKHSLEELKELTAGKVVSTGVAAGDDVFIAAGATTADDLALQLQLAAAFLTDPGYRPEAMSQWANLVPVIDAQIGAQPQSVAGARLPILLANGDQRFGVPAGALLKARTLAEVQASYAALAKKAPIEITLVGDFDEAKAIAAVASSFGALPTRDLAAPAYAAERRASFRVDPAPIRLTHAGPADQAMVVAAWPTDDDSDYRQAIGLDLLASVLDLMLTDSVRERLGASYGVSIDSSMSSTYRDFGSLTAGAVVAPDKLDEVEKAMADAAASLRDTPVTADLLARARNPRIEAVAKSLRENSYWLGAIDEAQSAPERLQRIRDRRAFYEAVTPADIQRLARAYLTPNRVRVAHIVSEKTAAVAAK